MGRSKACVFTLLGALLMACGGGDSSNDRSAGSPPTSDAEEVPTTEATTTTVDPRIRPVASEIVGYLEGVEIDVAEIRADCQADQSDVQTRFRCNLGLMTGTMLAAERVILVGYQIEDELAGVELPASVDDTVELTREVESLRDEAADCPEALTADCPTSRGDVLRGIDDVLALLAAWRALG